MPAKVADSWWLVLLRGVIESAFLAAFFLPELHQPAEITLFVGGLLVAGSVVEFLMALRLPGHAFRGILFFSAISAAACGGFLLYHYPATLPLVIVISGLWLAIRGFAALWLGLSIVSGVFDRLVPISAGLIGLFGGCAVMVWFPDDMDAFITLLTVYGAAAGLLTFVLTWRLWWEKRRRIKEVVAKKRE